ncbi:amino acid permease [Paludibacterium yongneupense]|uniref:amino acid permease n=1 Tax=Paludibacterium yongneupense TaxID=400061 RepID=UPI00040C2535|nr:amino acid permease [Paludibacterium yongneupense]
MSDKTPEVKSLTDADAHELHKMGYTQELARRMHGFSNFAISFSTICILAGGITSFQAGFSSTGGFGIGVGWLVGGAFALIVAAAMAQIASAYPTAGGLYHWSSILGGRGWGWATAWVNLLGLIFVVASVNVGVYTLFSQLVLTPVFGIDVSHWGPWQQALAVSLITASQAVFNHIGIRVTSKLTDFSGYLILAVAVILTLIMFYSIPVLDVSRLFTFVNNSGAPGGNVIPHSSGLMAFALGLLLPMYTITGFDASAHTAEETVNAKVTVPRSMLHAVLWSVLFGYILICSFVLAMHNPAAAAKDGGSVVFNLLAGLPIPVALKSTLYIAIVVANYLCALACVTSTSRMVFAFARDGGLPGSHWLRRVSPRYKSPVNAVWTVAVLSVAATLYSPAFTALAAGCAMFLYVSYAMPIAAGLFAEGKTWTDFGPFRLGALSKPFAAITVLGVLGLIFIALQPPNDIIDNYAIASVVLLVGGWFLFERRRFVGPPQIKPAAAGSAESEGLVRENV